MNSIFTLFPSLDFKNSEEISRLYELVKPEGFSIEQFRKSFQVYEQETNNLRNDIDNLTTDIDEFNETINNVTLRGREMKPFNKFVIRVLKHGDNTFINSLPFSRFIYGNIRRYSSSDLISKYCTYLSDQAEDFGRLFFYVVDRENKLQDYTCRLLEKKGFYDSRFSDLEERITSMRKKKEELAEKLESQDLPDGIKRAVAKRFSLNCSELSEASKSVKKLLRENKSGGEEVESLVEWCSGMKNILALSKERMENQAEHIKETIPTYLQAISLNRSLRETKQVVQGLVHVIQEAQQCADEGIVNVIDFAKSNNIYKPFKITSRIIGRL